MKKKDTSQAGSALIMIFVGIALFAALGYAVAQMMSGGNSALSISQEKAGIYASEVLSYTRNVRQAVQDLRISNGCDDTDISFENNVVTAGYTNGANTACQVFHPDGGALSYTVPSTEWLDSAESASTLYGEWYFSGDYEVKDLNDGTTELTIFLPWVHESICDTLNSKIGINAANAQGWSFVTNQKYTGSFGGGEVLGDEASEFDGKMTGCITDSNGDFFFYQVLIAR